jgi:hypothetical protein
MSGPPRRSASFATVTVLALAASFAALACTAKEAGRENAGSVDLDELAECRDYFQSLDACMRRLAPSEPRLAQGRVENARLAMSKLASPDARRTCADGATQLRTSCH